jgi:glycogen(starch) synthase
MVAERYGWAAIARRTVEAYGSALRHAPALDVKQVASMLAGSQRPRIVVPEGNLLSL